MKEYKLLINKKILLGLAIIGFVILATTTFLEILNNDFSGDYPRLIQGIGIAFMIVPWVNVLIDILRNPIKNKFMWFVGLFTPGPLTMFLYLINRETHLRLYKIETGTSNIQI